MQQFFYYLTYPIRAIFSSPRAIFAAPRRIFGLSLETRVALLVALLLIVFTLIAYIFVPNYFGGREVWRRWDRMIPMLILLIVIPLVVHRALRLWLRGEESRYPDIDAAWRQGLAALQQQGIDLAETPIFVVLGIPNENQAGSLFAASQISFSVRDLPEGPAALHWYARHNAIFLCCTRAGCLSLLAEKATDDSGFAASPAASAAKVADPVRGTIVFGGESALETPTTPAAASKTASDFGGSDNIYATMDISRFMSNPQELAKLPDGAFKRKTGGLRPLLTKEADEQSRRLEHVCRLLRRAREPLCAFNGILTVLPFHVLEQSDGHGSEVQLAAKADLALAHQVSQLCCPVVALVGGMETHEGFRELVRRVGSGEAREGRFGQGQNVWVPPAPEEIEALVKNACGKFEDWAYGLFQEPDGLRRTGNDSLYQLLCLVRHELEQRLESIMVGAYAHDDETDGSTPFMVGGCYFAATGKTADLQAFTKGIFQKLVGSESDLEWTQAASDDDRRCEALSNWLTVANGAIILACIAMVIYRFLM